MLLTLYTQPLSDVFSSNPRGTPVSSRANKFNKQITQFAIAQDVDARQPTVVEPEPLPPKSHTDSGYHGSSQEEMDLDVPADAIPPQWPTQASVHDSELRKVVLPRKDAYQEDRRTTEGSFHSAKEEQTAKVSLAQQRLDETGQTKTALPEAVEASTISPIVSKQNLKEQNALRAAEQSTENDFEDIGSPSDGSTPDRPLVRKSSLTFASLPAREPLKRSLGARTSKTSQLDQAKTARSSYLVRHTGEPQTIPRGPEEQPANDGQEMQYMDDDRDDAVEVDESDPEVKAAKLHHKFSTQRLHEKIDMLGKPQATRPSKSIPSVAALAASHLRQSEAVSRQERSAGRPLGAAGSVADDDDDWIKPLASPPNAHRLPLTKCHTVNVMEGLANDDTEDEEEFDMRAPELITHEEGMRTPVRMSPGPGKLMSGYGHVRSASTATLVSPGKAATTPPASPAKTISVSNPQFPSTTPQGSPRRGMTGTLSASKSRLQSIMKTAKGLFTSSAGVSAAAKLETLSPNALRMAANNMPGLYPSLNGMLEDKPLPPSPPKEGRKTRSSSEREKEEKKKEKEARAQLKVDNQLEKAREQEKQKAAQYKEAQQNMAASINETITRPSRSSPRRVVQERGNVESAHESNDMAPPAVPTQPPKLSRPTKPMREISQRSKPHPVAIRVGTLSQRMPMTTSSLASNLQETLQSAEARRPGPTKKASNASLQSVTSNPGFKISVPSQPTKPRALLAAERKKEQDEREVQRKAEQKRELERKRAAQQEEAKKQEQRQQQEAERKERERVAAEQAKRAAQKQAIDRKRMDDAKKLEQQRLERAANDAVSNEVDTEGLEAYVRQPPAGSARPPSRLGTGQPLSRSLINHPLPTNPAKPAKRPLEEDLGQTRQQAPRFGAAAQQTDAKRRRTEDESIIEVAPRPTMSGAPIRQSNLGKKPSIFNHAGYAPAPSAPHVSQAQSQGQQFPHPPNPHRIVHPMAMAQYANGAKIPFADAPNPPAHNSKTPASSYQHKTLQLVKSSPQYPNGEAIHLPEIPTDSEDEDSGDEGNAFPVPDWATPGHLTDQLIRQEGIDGDAVFGPIAPLKMEEIFTKGSKDRLKRMRERTSSANWAISGDGLTLEEVRADREQRERMRREGGWRYGS
jgi:hypothetical protein